MAKCSEIIQDSIVSLRGWDYPHINRDGTVNGQDWVESECDWSTHIEYWRFYQSGQFIHHMALQEDYAYEGENILSIISTLYQVTEIFEFVARLTAKGIYSEGMDLSISLHNTENRTLKITDPLRSPLFADHTCRQPQIVYQESFSQDELLGKSRALALFATEHVFERFNWNNPPINIMAEDQLKLLERRL
ncbi:hypothetical protein HN911_13705 [Candidatus Bathyarchaeota archaeon]|nr:hypothetical protein [Candidatus Bathyarchaeota archaeon]MBT7913763.1 hypothetical protein [Candidatus Bathyarchaeota archaeon]